MKKAKLLLSSIALLSLIGGIFAFKTQHSYSANYFCYIKDSVQVINGGLYTSSGTDCFTLYCTTQQGGKYRPTQFCADK